MMKYAILFRTVLFLIALQAPAVETVWTYAPPSGYVDASPAVGDLTDDGVPELVLVTVSGMVIVLDNAGGEVWRQELRGAICVPPSIGNLNEHPGPEVVILTRQGQIFCLAGDSGRELWHASLPDHLYWGETTLSLGDVTGDGALDIVAGDRNSSVACYRGTGELLWLYQGDHGVTQAPAIADLNGDGQTEVLISGNEVSLVCLSSEGKELWRRGESAGSSPLVYDITGDGSPEILICMGTALTALDGTGQPLWSYPMKREMDSALTIADADGDSVPEIYAIDLVGHMACLSAQGQLRWSAHLGERDRRSPSIADIDGDGIPEILAAGYSGALHVFTPDGRLKERMPLPGKSNSTATLIPLRDGGLGVVIPLASESVYVYRWPGSRADAAVLWPQYRFDALRSGYPKTVQEEMPVTFELDAGRMYAGANSMTVTLHNPEGRSITLLLEALRNTDKPVVSKLESSDLSIVHPLAYIVPTDRAINLTLNCTLSEGEKVLARRSHTVYLTPFIKEMTDAGALLDEIDRQLPQLPDRDGLVERSSFLRLRRNTLYARVPEAGALPESNRIILRDDIMSLLTEINALHALTSAASLAAETGSTLMASGANPWAPFGGLDEISEGRLTSPDLTVEAFGGETESAALNLFNMSSQTRIFRVALEPLTQADATVPAHQAITLHETLDVPTEMRDKMADALPLLNTANIIQMPPWSARQLWLNINTEPLAAGNWTSRIQLRSLDVEPVELVASLNVTVWPVSLPKEQPLRLCHWGYVHSSRLKDYPEEALADQLRNGTNVFVGLFYPKAQYNEQGELTGPIDFTEHDTYVKQHAPHGIILFCGYQSALKGPGGMESEAYAKAHVSWLRAWAAHLKELGVDYSGYALYPVDEPGLSDGLVEHYLLMAKLAREADPNIQMYTDPVGRISEDELREMLPYVDIWCPNRDGLMVDKTNAAKLDLIKSDDAIHWMYECAGNAKHQSPLGYYRAQAWLAWHHNLTGIGFWSYCTSQDDPWHIPGHRHDYLMVYPGNGVVASKRWEAVRDGVEDYRMLTALRDATSTLSQEEAEAAASLLTKDADIVAFYCGLDQNDTLLSTENPAEARALADRQHETIQSIRREIARMLSKNGG